MRPQERARILRPLIEEAAESLSDAKALQGIELFKHWVADHDYVADERFQFDGRLYRVRQAHHSQENWTPDITPALYEEVAEEGQGTKDNPIPYNNNMELEEGKYYIQYDVEYYCFRSTGIAVYNDLADLVNIYVNVVEDEVAE